METLRQMGGWSNYTMLMTYTHPAADDLKGAHSGRSPLDKHACVVSPVDVIDSVDYD